MLEGMVLPPDAWKVVSVPLMAGAVGGLTGWLALRLSLSALLSAGGRCFAGADTLAMRAVDRVLGGLVRADELLRWMEPEKIAAHLVRHARPRIEEYVDDVMMAHNPVFWENLPLALRQRAYRRARRALPRAMERLVDDLMAHLGALPDIRFLFAQRWAADPALAARWFREVGGPSCGRLPAWGFIGGALAGLVPAVLLLWVPAAWLMPVCGVVAGVLGYRLGLAVLFRPWPEHRRGVPVAGVFLRHRQQAAEAGAQLVGEELLALRFLMAPLTGGACRGRWRALVARHFRPLLGGALVRAATRRQGGLRLSLLEDKAEDMVIEAFADERFSRERGRLLVPRLAGRLEALAGPDFQHLLRPLFHRVGAMVVPLACVIGLLAGVANWWLLFGGH